LKNPSDILKQYWGYDAFRPLQEDIIQNALNGKDGLALLPTGGGKSICFQVPALCQEGICIVISPLIALMKDQVYNLKKRGIAAAAIYSGMSRRELDIVFENACNGAYKLLYMSPERLKTDLAIARIQRMNVNLLAIDEAHCISQWGYDFRPPYLEIMELRKILPNVPVMALTATATQEVVDDIQERLDFKEKKVFQQSFLRTNLSYSVLYEKNKIPKVLSILRSVPGTAIIYASSRGDTKSMATYLVSQKISADYYHAGLTSEERSTKQEDWITDKTRVICCTNAFGMGIDKPDVRLVIHTMMPNTLEAYFQEAGRAGRDGKKAYTVLLYDEIDGSNLRDKFEISYPPIDEVRHIYRALGSYLQLATGAGLGESFDFDFQGFCDAYNLDLIATHSILRLLEMEGWIVHTEAAATPAQVMLTATREVLYDFQLRNKNADLLIKALLRLYSGVTEALTDISEKKLMEFTKLDVKAVFATLNLLHKEGLLVYLPRKDKPQITFIRERVNSENLTIDQDKFNFRKRRAEDKMEKAISFAEAYRCRSRMLLQYFGEKEAKNCGICDICTGRNKPEIPIVEYETYQKKIKEVLRAEPLTIPQILEAFAEKRQNAVTKVLQEMLNEGELETLEGGKLRVG
jgi:ATP-dependent DNA helicase RecQ